MAAPHPLMAKIRRGDRKAFEELFEQYYQPLCLYLQRFTRDWDTSQEMAQAVFVKFWQKRKRILITTSIKSYLYRMAYHEFLMQKRRKNKEADLIERLTYEALQDYKTLTKKEREQKIKRLKKSIDKLPEACQEVLKMKMAGASYKEIAGELNISVKTVESQMRIAYIKLREDLRDALVLFLLGRKLE